MKRLFLILTIAVAAALVLCGTGCDRAGPTHVLSKFLDASLHGRNEEAYQYLSARDRAAKSRAAYLAERADEGNTFAKFFREKISYEIQEIKVDGDRAEATVEVTMPDPAAILSDFMGAAMSAGGDEAAIRKKLEEQARDNTLPMTVNTATYKLVKEADGWKVFLDWENQPREEQNQTGQ